MNTVDRAANEVKPWIVRTARLGFAAKALVYFLIGIIAGLVATGQRSQAKGSRGALSEIVDKPFGRLILVVIAVGLFGYLAWRIVDAVKDASNRGRDLKGITLRITTALKGLGYGLFGAQAIRIASGSMSSAGSDDRGPQHWTGTAMHLPLGTTIVLVAGICIVGYGLYQIFNAARGKLSRDLWLEGMPEDVRRTMKGISRFGIGARGVVFGIIGWLVVVAAREHDPKQARGIAGALEQLRSEPYGGLLLLVISAGLIAYAVYQALNARYRRIRVA